jgi:cation diffusion facilitator CzcD-associated flavoprotein CzcO
MSIITAEKKPKSEVNSTDQALKAQRLQKGRELAREWLSEFEYCLSMGDLDKLGTLFHPESYWRDMLAFQWDFRTHSGLDRIVESWRKALQKHQRPLKVQIEESKVAVFDRKGYGESVEAFFKFETTTGVCRGHLRLLKPLGEDSTWNGWTLFTSLEDIKGQEERACHHRRRRTQTDEELDASKLSKAFTNPDVLVLGAGQCGLAVAARLKQLNLETLVVDRVSRVGDNWRNRYQSLMLHNQIWANHLPYLPFPSSWPAYLSKDELADWLEIYAKALQLNLQLGTLVESATHDESSGRWTVKLRSADGTLREVYPRHVIQATGVFGVPKQPSIPGADLYTGTLIHAEAYGANFPAENSRVLVIGTGSSGHDVAQDLCRRNATVTMLQRSSTCVVSVEPGAARAYSIFAEDGPPVEDADLVTNSMPFTLLKEFHKQLTQRIATMDKGLLDGLKAAGFALDFGEDGSGFLMKYHRYGGGYYINSGCSELIAAGSIKVKSGTVQDMAENNVNFSDGTIQTFDAIVIAAGYENMSESVRAVFGDSVANRVGPVWGLDNEGEVRAMWRPTGQPGFWLMGGSLQQCRPYSKYLAMQIKAIETGLATTHKPKKE